VGGELRAAVSAQYIQECPFPDVLRAIENSHRSSTAPLAAAGSRHVCRVASENERRTRPSRRSGVSFAHRRDHRCGGAVVHRTDDASIPAAASARAALPPRPPWTRNRRLDAAATHARSGRGAGAVGGLGVATRTGRTPRWTRASSLEADRVGGDNGEGWDRLRSRHRDARGIAGGGLRWAFHQPPVLASSRRSSA
jgi:hypothetical protein